jgi:hypothetical protein
MALGAPAYVSITPKDKGTLWLVVGTAPDPALSSAPTVIIPVTAAEIGSGALIPGAPKVQIAMGVRRPPGNVDLKGTLTTAAPTDASLTSASSPYPIPTSTISWTTAPVAGCDSQIQASGFTGAPNQWIGEIQTIGPQDVVWLCGNLTFYFDNARWYAAGTYKGTVSFTASRP